MSSSTSSTSTSINTSAPTANTTATISTAPGATIFHDLWTFNFAVENLIQHKIRLVKVNGQSFIAFSKFFFNPFTNTYQPTQKQYFIPQHRWAQLQRGLIELNNFLTCANNGPSAATGGLSTATGSSLSTGSRSVPITTPPNSPNTIIVNTSTPTAGYPITTSNLSTSKSSSSTGRTIHGNLRAPPTAQSDATKRGRGRPPKEYTLPKKSKPTTEEGKGAGEASGWLIEESTLRAATTRTAAAVSATQQEDEERIEAAIASAAADPNLG